MFPPIHVDHTPHVRAAFEHKQDAVGRLINLKRERGRIHARDSRRQTEPLRIVFRDVGVALIVSSFRPWEKRDVDLLLWLRGSGKTTSGAGHVSYTGRLPGSFVVAQIGMAIGQARRRRNVLPRERGRDLLAVKITLRQADSLPEQKCGEYPHDPIFHPHLLLNIIFRPHRGVY